jgi:hypothetical protein
LEKKTSGLTWMKTSSTNSRKTSKPPVAAG